MSMTMRVSLPGYDVLTDTNPDHFGLIADGANFLIKEYTRGNQTISDGGSVTINHNFGYVPFFLVYYQDPLATDRWYLVGHSSIFSNAYCYSNTSTLTIFNNSGASTKFYWYVFYDNQVSSAANAPTMTGQGIRVTKPGYDVLSETDINNYVFHSDFNTFKILKEGRVDITATADGTYFFPHSSPLGGQSAFLCFFNISSDQNTDFIGNGSVTAQTRTGNNFISNVFIDVTNIKFFLQSDLTYPFTVKVKYYIFEPPLS